MGWLMRIEPFLRMLNTWTGSFKFVLLTSATGFSEDVGYYSSWNSLMGFTWFSDACWNTYCQNDQYT